MAFDPHYEWLGIPPDEQPPNYYRLLGIRLYEDSPKVIENAADQRMLHLKTFQNGPQSSETQQLLNEVSQARICLLNDESKAAYDAQLRAESNLQTGVPAVDRREHATSTAERSPTRPGAKIKPGRIQIIVGGLAGFVIVVLALCYGLGFRWFGKHEARQGKGTIEQGKSKARGDLSKPAKVDPSALREQRLKTLIDSLKSSVVLRMTFDRETLTGPATKLVVKDLSGHENHGAIHGAVVVPGVKGEALSFTGRSYVDCGNAVILEPNDAFSISVWVHPIKGGDYPRIVSKFTTYELRWQSYYTDPGPVRFVGVFGRLRATRKLPYQKWHHIVIARGASERGGMLRMYHNGSLLAETKSNRPKAAKRSGHLYLGVSNRTHKYEHYRGWLDELTILNREMTAGEVREMYRATAPIVIAAPAPKSAGR